MTAKTVKTVKGNMITIGRITALVFETDQSINVINLNEGKSKSKIFVDMIEERIVISPNERNIEEAEYDGDIRGANYIDIELENDKKVNVIILRNQPLGLITVIEI